MIDILMIEEMIGKEILDTRKKNMIGMEIGIEILIIVAIEEDLLRDLIRRSL